MNKKRQKLTCDVLVIGGGPAGMMAAGRAAELGARVILVEKNDSLGKKLLITGGGRCNVTNAEYDNRKLLSHFKDAAKFLHSPFSTWSVKESLDFFHQAGMETKVENEGRVFPISNKAQSVWDVLVNFLKKGQVQVISNCKITDLVVDEVRESDGIGRILGAKGDNLYVIARRGVIIATGGTSRPETGSTGDGYKWLRKLGHTIIDPTPSLVPLKLKDTWVKRAAGTALSNAKLNVFQNGVKQTSNKGKILFTHVGLSGPAVLNLSKDIGELLKYGDVTIQIDLLPALDHSGLNMRLQEIFKENDKKKFKNSLKGLIPPSLIPVIVELSQIDPEIMCNSIKREQRMNLIQLLKNLPVKVDSLLGTEKAIITSGGVILDEIEPRTMCSRLYDNLFLIGDILNIDRPSGGYSLQLCWTTGYVAGTAASSLRQSDYDPE